MCRLAQIRSHARTLARALAGRGKRARAARDAAAAEVALAAFNDAEAKHGFERCVLSPTPGASG